MRRFQSRKRPWSLAVPMKGRCRRTRHRFRPGNRSVCQRCPNARPLQAHRWVVLQGVFGNGPGGRWVGEGWLQVCWRGGQNRARLSLGCFAGAELVFIGRRYPQIVADVIGSGGVAVGGCIANGSPRVLVRGDLPQPRYSYTGLDTVLVLECRSHRCPRRRRIRREG